eukprot:CAMPEP_0113264434 /NCGR_PEP_ID=MMETSP0008_2-20120614/18972_1 /TAXON_ID=97485 /ORGANISM="Prymnesium parvum" /LENGTH=71 /DNA_ID=CAMNT_0000113197 /DNA_START=119 /DNA_END=332 /DNA_ORIENTATION=+ /assembly_acc=CAM_ASM_000153
MTVYRSRALSRREEKLKPLIALLAPFTEYTTITAIFSSTDASASLASSLPTSTIPTTSTSSLASTFSATTL